MSDTKEKCTRCGGHKLYFVRVLNGHGVPAQPYNGICYRCNGSGEEPQSQIKEEKQIMQITKEQQQSIFSIMVDLITAKGDNRKMVSTFDIHDVLKAQGVSTSKIIIESVLDVLIQHKYVRYYKDVRNYTYYGITQLGWDRWTAKVAQTTQPAPQVEPEPVVEIVKPKRGRPRKIKEAV